MTNGDPEGRIFLSYRHTIEYWILFLAHHCFHLFIMFIYLPIYLFQNKLPEVPEYAKMRIHMMTLLDVLVR